MPRLLTGIEWIDNLWLHSIAPPSELSDSDAVADATPKKTAPREPKPGAED